MGYRSQCMVFCGLRHAACDMLLTLDRQSKCEHTAGTFLALDPDAATVGLDSQFAKGQAQARATHFAAAHLAEFFENTLIIGARDTSATILNPHDQPILLVDGWMQRQIGGE